MGKGVFENDKELENLGEIHNDYNVLIRSLERLTNDKKEIHNSEAWIEFLKMDEFKECMFYEKWLNELEKRITDLNIPVLFFERLCCMYIEEADRLEGLSFDIKPFLKFLKERNKFENVESKNNKDDMRKNIRAKNNSMIFSNEELEKIKERKKAHRVLSKYLKKITDSQKVISNPDNWSNLLKMSELEICMFHEKWLDELKSKIIPLRIPVFFYEGLYNMYVGKGKELDVLLFDIRPFLKFLKENINYGLLHDESEKTQNDEMEQKHRTWLFKYYKIFNQKPPLNVDEWDKFFKKEDFLEVQYYPKTMEMIGTYYYSQDSYTQALLQGIYNAYEFSDYTIEKKILYGTKYEFLYETVSKNLENPI